MLEWFAVKRKGECGVISVVPTNVIRSIYSRIAVKSMTYLFELILIHDYEAVSVSRPLDDSTVHLTFCVNHYPELQEEHSWGGEKKKEF